MRELLYAVDEQDRVHTLSAYTLLITHHIYIIIHNNDSAGICTCC